MTRERRKEIKLDKQLFEFKIITEWDALLLSLEEMQDLYYLMRRKAVEWGFDK